MPKIFYGLFFLLLLFFSDQAHAAIHRFHQSVSPDLLEEIRQIFPESQEVQPRLLDYNINPNIHLFQDAKISVTFLGSISSNVNEFGYFIFVDKNQDGEIQIDEISSKESLFEKVSTEAEGGPLAIGDSVEFGKFSSGTQIGFYLTTPGEQGPLWTFYTLDKLNFDGHRHLAMMATEDGQSIALGIEDLPWEISDHDFNDILFSVSTDPPDAIHEVIRSGNIPSSATPQPQIESPPLFASKAKLSPASSPSPSPVPMYLEGNRFGCSLHPSESRNFALTWFAMPLVLCWVFFRLAREKPVKRNIDRRCAAIAVLNRAASTSELVGKSRERSAPLYR